MIPTEFGNPRTGTYDFFISIPINPMTGVHYTLQDILDRQAPFPSNETRGVGIAARLAWKPLAEDLFGFATYKGRLVLTEDDPFFPNPGEELRRRGQVTPAAVPVPGALSLPGLGLLAAAAGRRRFNPRGLRRPAS